jgi:hypothetical protein
MIASMSRDALDAALRSSGVLLSTDGRYVDSVDRPLDEVFKRTHLFGLTRELALSRVGTWASSLFAYETPQCGFRRSEQRLLLAALRGETDQELACRLGISLSTVKKTWLPIYEQISNHLPMFLSDRFAAQEGGERGKEKSSDYSPTSANTRKSYVPQLLRTLMASCRRPTPKMAYEILASGNH